MILAPNQHQFLQNPSSNIKYPFRQDVHVVFNSLVQVLHPVAQDTQELFWKKNPVLQLKHVAVVPFTHRIQEEGQLIQVDPFKYYPGKHESALLPLGTFKAVTTPC